jgi:hypothetical protein
MKLEYSNLERSPFGRRVLISYYLLNAEVCAKNCEVALAFGYLNRAGDLIRRVQHEIEEDAFVDICRYKAKEIEKLIPTFSEIPVVP